MLVQGPVAVHDVAGVDVAAAEVILHRVTVLAELHHLALEVGPLVDAHAVGPLAGLEEHGGGESNNLGAISARQPSSNAL